MAAGVDNGLVSLGLFESALVAMREAWFGPRQSLPQEPIAPDRSEEYKQYSQIPALLSYYDDLMGKLQQAGRKLYISNSSLPKSLYTGESLADMGFNGSTCGCLQGRLVISLTPTRLEATVFHQDLGDTAWRTYESETIAITGDSRTATLLMNAGVSFEQLREYLDQACDTYQVPRPEIKYKAS